MEMFIFVAGIFSILIIVGVPIIASKINIHYVRNDTPKFNSNKEALSFYRSWLENISCQMNLTPSELIIEADDNIRPSALEEEALMLSRKINILENLIEKET